MAGSPSISARAGKSARAVNFFSTSSSSSNILEKQLIVLNKIIDKIIDKRIDSPKQTENDPTKIECNRALEILEKTLIKFKNIKIDDSTLPVKLFSLQKELDKINFCKSSYSKKH